MADIDRAHSEMMEAVSDIGIARERNEDSILYMELTFTLADKRTVDGILMLVCDGMGGLEAGNWASAYCCQSVEKLVEEQAYTSINDFIERLEKNIYITNNDIVKQNKYVSQQVGKKVRAGSTFTLLFIHDHIAHLRHLGDSRLYELIPKASGDFDSVALDDNVSIVSEDQSDVMRQVRQGKLTYEEAMNSDHKNVLYMCMGVFPSNRLEIFKLDFEIHPEASYLICTDGFWHHLSTDDFIQLASREKSLSELINREKQLDGERDNISAVIYHGMSDSPKATSESLTDREKEE